MTTPDFATIGVERVTDEHLNWLACHPSRKDIGKHVVVRRREGFLAAVHHIAGTVEQLDSAARWAAATHCAEYVPPVGSIPAGVGGFPIHGVHSDRATVTG